MIYKCILCIMKENLLLLKDSLEPWKIKLQQYIHSTVKMKPVDVNSRTYIDFSKENSIIKILNLKFLILLEYKNVEIFLQKVTLQIDLKKVLWLKKLKILCRGNILLAIATENKSLECLTKKNSKK